jgi:hypothetical protein
MEPQFQQPGDLDQSGHDEARDLLARVAAHLILTHQRADGSIATQGLARQLASAAQTCNVQPAVLLRAVVSQLPPLAARRLTNALPPASLAPRAPWPRKSCVYRALDALAPVRWSRYRLGRSRYAWVRQRAAHRPGLEAFTVIERATDAAIARFASVVSLRCFACLFAGDADFRDASVRLVRTQATPELENPSGAGQRLNMVALSDLAAWHAGAQAAEAQADHQLGAELVMLAIPASVFDTVTAQIRTLIAQRDILSNEDHTPLDLTVQAG